MTVHISTDDQPRPLTTCWLYWIAVSTGDQAGVMTVLGLNRLSAVTFAEAAAVIEEDGHAGSEDSSDGLARVYVSPEVDGWTLVVGPWCDPCDGERSDELLRLCTELSARYGRAQAYYFGERGDGSAWLVAERGTVLRRYCATGQAEDTLLTLGEPLRLERSRREHLGLSPIRDEGARDDKSGDEWTAEDDWEWEAFYLAPEIAAELGISPLALTEDTRVRGTGVLALTSHARSSIPTRLPTQAEVDPPV